MYKIWQNNYNTNNDILSPMGRKLKSDVGIELA
jgi:hypothetical protein